MKLVERDKYAGINRHSIWIFEQDKRRIGINCNLNVLGDNYYLFDLVRHESTYGIKKGKTVVDYEYISGEGCDTIRYPTLEVAKKEVQRLFDTGENVKNGHDFGICKECSCHYSYGTKEYDKYPDHACKASKEKHAAGGDC